MTQEEQPPRQVGIRSDSGGDINIKRSRVNIAGHDIVNVFRYPRAYIQGKRDRKYMLAEVRTFWITNILEKSLGDSVRVELMLREQSDAVAHPLKQDVREAEQPPRQLPYGTRILHVYDQANGKLLILGEPGAGKTTLLLELARDLLDRAEQDGSHPMPVVFNLSSWSIKRLPLASWLVEELREKYVIDEKQGQQWIDKKQILPLLDGLDEVAPQYRVMCINIINAFRQRHGLVPTVVCSRSTDYLDQSNRLQLHSAIIAQPLTPQQINDCLSSAGGQLEAMRVALLDDKSLQDMVTTPLMLRVLIQIYRGASVEDLLTTSTIDARRRQVFEKYVERMLQRRGARTLYKPQQTIDWLAWLARQLVQHNQTEFSLLREPSQIQQDWLPDSQSRQFYRSTVAGWAGGLAGILIGPLVGALLGWLLRVPVSPLVSGLLGNAGRLIASVQPFWISVGFGAISVQLSWIGVVFGSIVVFLGTVKVIFQWLKIKWLDRPIELLIELALGLVLCLFLGLFLVVPIMLIVGLADGWLDKLIVGLVVGLVAGLIIGLINVRLNTGLSVMLGGLAGLLAGGLTGVLVGWSIIWLVILAIPAVLGNFLGSDEFIQAPTLRLALQRTGCIPRNYTRFLNYAVECGLLYNGHGGYFFVHQLLLDYFATLDIVSSSNRVAEQGEDTAALDAQKRVKEAIVAYNRALQTDDIKPLDWQDLGLRLGQGSLHREALDAFEHALQLDPSLVISWKGKGTALRVLQRNPEALKAFEAALSLEPDNAFVLNGKGETLSALQQPEQALAAFDAALQLDPCMAQTWSNKGILLKQQKQYPEALSAFDQAITCDGSIASYWNDKGLILYEMGNLQDALRAYRKALDRDTNYAPAWYGVGNVLADQQNLEGALDAYERAIKCNPYSVEAWSGHGDILSDLGNFYQALDSYNKVLRLDSHYAAAWNGKADVFYQLELYDQARDAYERSLQITPDASLAWNGMGNVLYSMGDNSHALDAYEHAIQLNPQMNSIWCNKSRVLKQMRCYEEALIAAEEAIQHAPNDPDGWQCKAQALKKLGRRGDARAAKVQVAQLQNKA